MRIDEELFRVGNPMSGRSGSDVYSYMLREIIDKEKGVIRVCHHDFDPDPNPWIDYNNMSVPPLGGSFYKLDARCEGCTAFGECKKNEKGNWVFEQSARYRSYIYLTKKPVTTRLDPSF